MRTYKSQSWLRLTTDASHEISLHARECAKRSIQHILQHKVLYASFSAQLSRSAEGALQLCKGLVIPVTHCNPIKRVAQAEIDDVLTSITYHLSLCRVSDEFNPLPRVKPENGRRWAVDSRSLCGGLVLRYSYKRLIVGHPVAPGHPPLGFTTHLLVFSESGAVFGVAAGV